VQQPTSSSEENDNEGQQELADVEKDHIQVVTDDGKHFSEDKKLMKKARSSGTASVEPAEEHSSDNDFEELPKVHCLTCTVKLIIALGNRECLCIFGN